MVIWKKVPGFNELEASNTGLIRRRIAGENYLSAKGHVYKARVWKRGYLVIRVTIKGKRRALRVHRLVCLAFHGPCPKGMGTAHWDGNQLHNTPRNLRWATTLENAKDRVRHGTSIQGEKHHLAKLRAKDIPVIRRLLAAGLRQNDIGKRFGVSPVPIWQINAGKTWKSIK